ncbi:MAG: hypothetical protein ACXVCP_15685 [Bdellovibrio sp.]
MAYKKLNLKDWNLGRLVFFVCVLFSLNLTKANAETQSKINVNYEMRPLYEVTNQHFQELIRALSHSDPNSQGVLVHSTFSVPRNISFFQEEKNLTGQIYEKILKAKVEEINGHFLVSKIFRFPIGEVNFEMQVHHIALKTNFEILQQATETERVLIKGIQTQQRTGKLKAVLVQRYNNFTDLFNEVLQVIGFFEDGSGRTVVDVSYVAVLNDSTYWMASLIPFENLNYLLKKRAEREINTMHMVLSLPEN